MPTEIKISRKTLIVIIGIIAVAISGSFSKYSIFSGIFVAIIGSILIYISCKNRKIAWILMFCTFLIGFIIGYFSNNFQTTTPEIKSTEIYAKYGFSFKYPKGMVITENKLNEDTPTDNSGYISGLFKNGIVETITLGWIKSVSNVSLEDLMEASVNGTKNLKDFVDVDRGNIIETTKDGYRMIYQPIKIITKTETVNAIYGTWRSTYSQRYYRLFVSSSIKDVLPTFQKYLDSFTEIHLPEK